MFVLDTKCLKDVSSITVVAGTSSYNLPSDIMDVLRVAHKGLKLERVSQYELDVLYNTDWTATNGTPVRYYVDLDPNNKKIYLYPNPQTADAGANLILDYVKIPPALSGDSSVPLDGHTLLTPYHDALAYKASSQLLDIDPSQESIAKQQRFETRYKEYVEHCINLWKGLEEPKPMNIYRGRNPYNTGR